MKYLLIILFILQACFGQAAEKANPLRILVVTDDRKFNREAFFAMFDSFAGIRWEEMSQPRILGFLGTDSILHYDAVVFYDMPEAVSPTESQRQAMLRFFGSNAPVIFLHHALLSYSPWDGFQDIIGGRYYNKTPWVTEAGDTLRSVYQHDVQYNVRIANTRHPVTHGLKNFPITDETYRNFVVKKDVEILLTTNHPWSGPVIGWVNKFGNSNIVYLMNGHDEKAYENPHFRRLLLNAIHWVASNKKAAADIKR